MRAIPLENIGPTTVLKIKDVPDPVASRGEVVVRVRRIGINYAEILSRKGMYGWAPKRPYIPGMEASGEIESVGAGVDPRRIGERVIVIAQHGAYAERIVASAEQVLPAVDGFSLEENAAFAVNYLTAWVALMEMARLRTTDRVLVTSAAGGVGTAAVQIASRFGCEVLAAVGSEAKVDTVRKLGASHAFAYPSLEAELRRATGGKGIDVALELVGDEVYRASFRSLAPLGRIVVVGFSSRPETQRWNPLSYWKLWKAAPRPDLMQMLRRSLGVASTHIGYLLSDAPDLVQPIWKQLTSFAIEHGIRPVVGAQLEFDRMPDAHALIESRRSIGKVVVRVA